MNKQTFLYGAILALVSCQSHYDGTVLEIDVDSAVEVNFEDVATDIHVIPLKSDIPLDQCVEIQNYGDETLIRTTGRKSMYYFVNGVHNGTLNAVGRGRGEYNSIQQFTYSPNSKILTILSRDNMLLRYSVPKMKFLGSCSIDGAANYMSEHNDSTLIVRMRYPGGGYGIRMINSRNGHPLKDIKELGGYTWLFDDHIGYYRQNNRILSVVGNVSTLSYLNDKGDEEIILAYSFKDKDIPKDMADFNFDNMQEMIRFYNYSKENEIYVGGVNCQKYDNKISFWYHPETVDDKFARQYVSIKKGEIENQYKGFKVKGLTIPIIPDCIDGNGGFTTIIQALPELIEDKNVEPSPLATEILSSLKNQSDNNPIIINYRIQ